MPRAGASLVSALCLPTLVLAITMMMAPLRVDAAPLKTLLKVEAAIDSLSLNAPIYATKGLFYVDSKITNVSGHDLAITVWTQYGWSWLSDHPNQIRPGIEALQNFPSRIVLKPEQEYVHKIEMWSIQKRRPIIFRLGFVPNANIPVSDVESWAQQEIFWSNPITLRR